MLSCLKSFGSSFSGYPSPATVRWEYGHCLSSEHLVAPSVTNFLYAQATLNLKQMCSQRILSQVWTPCRTLQQTRLKYVITPSPPAAARPFDQLLTLWHTWSLYIKKNEMLSDQKNHGVYLLKIVAVKNCELLEGWSPINLFSELNKPQ